MVRKAALILAFFCSPLFAQNDIPMTEDEKPWFLKKEWLEKNAPYGIDMTPDRKVWILMNSSLQGDEYAMLADDYEMRDPKWPKAWIRGYHKANPKVSYRESRTLYHFDCLNDTYYSTYQQTYKADRSLQSVSGLRSMTSPIVPGSIAEEWHQYACRPK